MSQLFGRRVLAGLSVAGALVACGPPVGTADLSMRFNPGAIDDQGQQAEVLVQAVNEAGQPGSGSVTISAAAGNLKASAATVTLDSNGEGSAIFTCAAAADPNCKGQVKVTVDWAQTKGTVTATKNIQVGPVLSGTDGGSDAGTPTFNECLAVPNELVILGGTGPWPARTEVTPPASFSSVQGPTYQIYIQAGPWSTVFVAPNRVTLTVGHYYNAALAEDATYDQTGLRVGRLGLGCSTVSGNFEIERLTRFMDGGMSEFAATYAQKCDGADQVTGCIHFTSPLLLPGGSSDGGSTNGVSLALEKPTLVVGTADKLDVTVTVKTPTGAPVVGTSVDFATTLGSFAMASGTLTVSGMTDAAGIAKATLFVAGASTGTAVVTATALNTPVTGSVGFVSVASIVVQPDPSVKSALGTQAGGRETTTPVLFKILDANNQPASGVGVTFAIGPGSPGGATVTPVATSAPTGVVGTTLQSGDSVGPVSVVATVTATIGQSSPITATATIQITGGKPSFRGLTVDCAKKNLAALTKPGTANGVPTRSLITQCSAGLADRFGNVVGLPTPVSWFAERGTITPALSAATGLAISPYDTTSNFLPNDTTPLASPAEPSNGTKNPRDMLISIIAVVAGEEEFSDGNSNGKWDPGEWFLDLPEPFVDENDNQQWDPGEAFIDTQRLNCTTGLVEPPNNKWDPPNGCWDNNTQIWATTHVIWTGSLTQPIQFAQPPPWLVPANTVRQIPFTWADPWFNPIANEGATMTATLIGTRGSAVVSAPGLPGDGLGLSIAYEKVEATESAAGSGIFTLSGICDTSKPNPTNPLTRCLSRYRFTAFGTGNAAQLQLTGGTPQPLLPDGGTPPPTPAIIHITGQNMFFTPASEDDPANFE